MSTVQTYSAVGVSRINGLVGALTLAEGTNVTLDVSGNTITINSSGGGGGGANTALSNLASVDINTSLLASSVAVDLGDSGTGRFGTTYTTSVDLLSSSPFALFQDDGAASHYVYVTANEAEYIGPSDGSRTSMENVVEMNGNGGIFTYEGGSFELWTRDDGAGSGDVWIGSGDCTTADVNSGDTNIVTGTVSGTGVRGIIYFNEIAEVDYNLNPWPNYYGVAIPSIILNGESTEAVAAYGAGLFYDGPGDGASLFIGTREQSDDKTTAHVEIRTGYQTGATAVDSGDLILGTGNSANGNSGTVIIASGSAPNGTRGRVFMNSAKTEVSASFVFGKLGAAPSAPVEAQVYWDTVSHKLMAWNGSEWKTFAFE